MLDSLGSTLSGETIDAFFASRGKDRKDGELTVDEAVQSLEAELFKPSGEKKRLDASDYRGALDDTMPGTPALGGKGAAGDPFGQLDFAGPAGHIPNEDVQASQKEGAKPNAPPAYNTESNQQPLSDAIGINKPSLTAALGTGGGGPDVPVRLASDSRYPSSPGSDRDPLDGGSGEGEDSSNSGSSSPTGRGAVERVINVKTCPLCHRPRLSKKGELDIVTHLAICASQDWERVNKIVVGNFVTSSQAQRKWMAKLIGKVSSGAYKLGAVSMGVDSIVMRTFVQTCWHRTRRTSSFKTG
jgi:phosphatidylserine decarboxylase